MTTLIGGPPEDIYGLGSEPVESMISEVASLVGGADSPTDRAKAMTCLDRAADRLNGMGSFFCQKKEEAYTSSDLTNNQEILEFPSDWGWPDGPAYNFDSGGDMIGRIEWKPWDIYREINKDPNSDIPQFATIKDFRTGIYLYPKIDTAKVDTIRVPYIARVMRISEAAGSDLLMPAELREALISGGSYFMTQYRYLRQPQVWQPMYTDFMNAARGAAAASQRWLNSTNMTPWVDTEGQFFGRSNTQGNVPSIRINW
jgi:hypothetical protein